DGNRNGDGPGNNLHDAQCEHPTPPISEWGCCGVCVPSLGGSWHVSLLFVCGRSGWWKLRVDRLSVRKLTLTLSAALHPFRRTVQLEVAAHALPIRPGEIGDDVPAVMLDEGVLGHGSPIRPPVPAGIPRLPQIADGLDVGVLRNLVELAF